MTNALTWVRLSYRQQRWELILVALGVAGAAGAMFWFASTLDGMRAANPDCAGFLRNQGDLGLGPPLECQSVIDEWFSIIGYTSMLQTFALVAPLGMGVILGGPLVAREVDGGTAQLGWSLSPSRLGWLARRVAFVALVVVLLLAIVAIASDVMAAATQPDRDLAEDFLYFGRRGLPVVAHGLGALLIGVVAGTIIGRVLPAVLASVLIIGLVFAGLSLGQEAWNRGEATVQRVYDATGRPLAFDYAAMDIDSGLQMPDGTFLTYSEAFARGLPPEFFPDDQGGVYASAADLAAGRIYGYEARLVIAAERYPDLVVRDVLLWLLTGFVALATAAVVVVRRRPV